MQGKKIINLGIGQPDFKTPEHIVDAAIISSQKMENMVILKVKEF